jgi:hypothetical protein
MHLDHHSVIPVKKGVRRLLTAAIDNLKVEYFLERAGAGERIEYHGIAPMNDIGIGFQASIDILGYQAVTVRGNDDFRLEASGAANRRDEGINVGVRAGVPWSERCQVDIAQIEHSLLRKEEAAVAGGMSWCMNDLHGRMTEVEYGAVTKSFGDFIGAIFAAIEQELAP